MARNFRDPVQFQRKISDGQRDGLGNLSGAWQPFLSARGWLRETSGKERIAAGRLEASATATLRLKVTRSAPAWQVTAEDRVLVRGQIWSVVSAPIDPVGRGTVIEFTLERGGAVG